MSTETTTQSTNRANVASLTSMDAWSKLQLLLRGEFSATHYTANALRVDAFGYTTFGRTDAVDLFSIHPLKFSSEARVLCSSQAIAVVDQDADGRTVGAFADLVGGVVARVWVLAGYVGDTSIEPAVPVARDDFMSQLRERFQGDAADHPNLQVADWPYVLELCNAAMEELPNTSAASSSQAWVMRAFSDGLSVVALVRLRLQASGLPRRAHHRVALAIASTRAQMTARDAAVRPPAQFVFTDSLLEPTPVVF